MFKNNKYTLTFITILLIVLFSFLIYKIIKSNEFIKDAEEEKDNLNAVIIARESVIRQMSKDKTKYKKNNKSDHETDYYNNEAPIEVFNNKASEYKQSIQKISSKKPILKLPITAQNIQILQHNITSDIIETPQFDQKTKAITNVINKIINNCDNETNIKLTSSLPIINLTESSDIESMHIKPLCELIENTEDSLPMSYIINNAVENGKLIETVTQTANDYSDTMYIVKNNSDENDDDEDDDDEDDEEVCEDDDGEVCEDDEEVCEDDDEEVCEDEDDDDEEVCEDEDDDEYNKDDKSEDNIDIDNKNNEIENNKNDNGKILINYMEKYNKECLLKKNINDLKQIARDLNIKLSFKSHVLNKNELINKIMEN